jgi:hypothetical protein
MCKDCQTLHEELHKQSEEMFWLRKQVTNLEACIRSERSDKRKLVKELKSGKKHQYKKDSRNLDHKEYDFVF